MNEIPVISGEAVLAAITPETAIECVEDAFANYAAGRWTCAGAGTEWALADRLLHRVDAAP